MAGPLLDIYGNYQEALDKYWQLADIYNTAGNQYNADINMWNAWVNAGAQGTAPIERPSDTFAMERPIEPIAPMSFQMDTTVGSVSPEELYQKTYGRSTPDTMTNEAWSLSNIGTPFLSSMPETAYETGGVAAINNPLSYVGPDALTTGYSNVDMNSLISGQNPYYKT